MKKYNVEQVDFAIYKLLKEDDFYGFTNDGNARNELMDFDTKDIKDAIYEKYINEIINDIEGSASVQIFDVTGRQIIANEFNGSACISAEALNDGIYIIRMIDDNGIKTQKIVIQ